MHRLPLSRQHGPGSPGRGAAQASQERGVLSQDQYLASVQGPGEFPPHSQAQGIASYRLSSRLDAGLGQSDLLATTSTMLMIINDP